MKGRKEEEEIKKRREEGGEKGRGRRKGVGMRGGG